MPNSTPSRPQPAQPSSATPTQDKKSDKSNVPTPVSEGNSRGNSGDKSKEKSNDGAKSEPNDGKADGPESSKSQEEEAEHTEKFHHGLKNVLTGLLFLLALNEEFMPFYPVE
ncbi:hypothetical protein O1611_g4496 [Lasiodiplodia mahajangana]|uniref:Uncharacterized protein n=1 Tax=Lasiodiplodia mahajangana TaxID=1108764 RepID=A0ACC2JNZ8_9PEZI|nr:hypothetical protein O1611_g4496 [Lasiodiplodia mahajangana]